MLLRCRITLYGRSIAVLTFFNLGSSACGEDVVIVTESASGTTTDSTSNSSSTGTPLPTTSATESVTMGGTGSTSTTDNTGGTSTTGGQVCEILRKECSDAAGCCEGGAFGGCPGTNYPYNWSCVSGFCEHGGCSGDLDCTNMLPGFECHVINDVGQCVAPCASSSDCAEPFIMSDLQCTGVSSRGNFCQ